MRHAIVLFCFSLVLAASVAGAATVTETYTLSPGMTIPDRASWSAPVGEAIGTMYTICPRVITGIRVRLDLTTAWSSDLRVWVESPAGTSVELLFIGEGGEPGTNPAGWYPTDFTPHEDMGQWLGEGADGTWTITCQDWSEGGGNSTLNSWSIEVTFDDTVGNEPATLGGVKAAYR